MKLIYRGTTYNYDPTKVKARVPFPHNGKSTYELIYRGNTYRFDPTIARLNSVKPSCYQLIFRGNTYQVNRNEEGEVTAITYSTSLFKHRILKTHSARLKNTD